MTPTELLDAIASELIAAGIARSPGTAGADPPVFKAPRDGAPRPIDLQGVEADDEAAISIFYSGGIVPDVDEGRTRRRLTVDFWIRVERAQAAFTLDAAIDERFIGLDKRGYEIGTGPAARTLISSEKWRELAPFQSSKATGFIFISAYLFEVYRD